MSAFASFLGRALWRVLLWLMRRPFMKNFQRWTVEVLPISMRDKARDGLIRQNRFARKIGLPMLTFMMSLVIGSVLITTTFMVAMHLYETGYLTIPRRIRHHLGE